MKLPTQEELRQAAEAFDRDWGAVDEVLYGICSRSPDHRDRRSVTAKVALVDRAYSAGLERQVKPDAGDQAITKIAAFVCANADQVDKIIARLVRLEEPLDAGAMIEIVTRHGYLTTLLQELTRKRTAPRSFVAKYLHFHAPVVPIYDSYAAQRLVKLVPRKDVANPPAAPEGSDGEYWAFCVRFLRLYLACRDEGLEVTVKLLDTWLWQVPTTHPVDGK